MAAMGPREPSTHGAQDLPGERRVDRAGILGSVAVRLPREKEKEELRGSILPQRAGHQAWPRDRSGRLGAA